MDLTPQNVDAHIALCRKFGFRKLLVYYPAFSGFMKGYETLGDYAFNSDVREHARPEVRRRALPLRGL